MGNKGKNGKLSPLRHCPRHQQSSPKYQRLSLPHLLEVIIILFSWSWSTWSVLWWSSWSWSSLPAALAKITLNSVNTSTVSTTCKTEYNKTLRYWVSWGSRKYLVCMVENFIKWRNGGYHKLSENVWFVWSKTSYSGDKWRCYRCGTDDDDEQGKIELLSLWAVGRLSFAISYWNFE